MDFLETLTDIEQTVERIIKGRHAAIGSTLQDDSVVPYSGYADICSKLHKLGEEPLGTSITVSALRMKLKLRLNAINEDLQRMDEEYDKRQLSQYCADKLASFKRKRFLLTAVWKALSRQCDTRTRFRGCACTKPVQSSKETCAVCVSALQEQNDDGSDRPRLLRSDMIGPAKCKCAACLKFQGVWEMNDRCTCYFPDHTNPLSMCTVCLCKLAIEQYIVFAPESLTRKEQVLYELRRRNAQLGSRRNPMGDGDEKQLRHNVAVVECTLMALIPDGAYEGCNGKGRLNACKCPEKLRNKSDMCLHCVWILKHTACNYNRNCDYYRVRCACMKCEKQNQYPPCECDYKGKKEHVSEMCTSCLCRYAVDLYSGKRNCLCEKNPRQYSCGSHLCPNPIKYCQHLKNEGGLTCDATFCINKIPNTNCDCWEDENWLSSNCKPTCVNTTDA
jgi:hypothetical protein